MPDETIGPCECCGECAEQCGCYRDPVCVEIPPFCYFPGGRFTLSYLGEGVGFNIDAFFTPDSYVKVRSWATPSGAGPGLGSIPGPFGGTWSVQLGLYRLYNPLTPEFYECFFVMYVHGFLPFGFGSGGTYFQAAFIAINSTSYGGEVTSTNPPAATFNFSYLLSGSPPQCEFTTEIQAAVVPVVSGGECVPPPPGRYFCDPETYVCAFDPDATEGGYLTEEDCEEHCEMPWTCGPAGEGYGCVQAVDGFYESLEACEDTDCGDGTWLCTEIGDPCVFAVGDFSGEYEAWDCSQHCTGWYCCGEPGVDEDFGCYQGECPEGLSVNDGPLFGVEGFLTGEELCDLTCTEDYGWECDDELGCIWIFGGTYPTEFDCQAVCGWFCCGNGTPSEDLCYQGGCPEGLVENSGPYDDSDACEAVCGTGYWCCNGFGTCVETFPPETCVFDQFASEAECLASSCYTGG